MNEPQIDSAKLESFLMRTVNDVAAGHAGVMVSLGARLGLYEAMAGAGPIKAKELASRTGCAERYVSEWLGSQVAGAYVDYDAVAETYELSPEHAMVLADEQSPVYMAPAWQVTATMWLDEEKTLEAFRTGRGVAWGDHEERLYCGVASFYRNAYRGSLVSQWLPALDGMVERLEAGITVADVGCGHGYSALLMAEAFPRSRFRGFDTHPGSIEAARRNAAEAGLDRRVAFDVARATDYPEDGYDLICFFDALHDMGDPVAAVRHAARCLAPNGSVMLIEPFANDRLEDNVSAVARLFYAGSVSLCCANAIADGGHLVLGAQAGEARLAEVFREAGFTRFRRAAQTPFNLILEARR